MVAHVDCLGSVFGLSFVIQYFKYPYYFLNQLEEEERAGCFTFITFLVSYDIWCSLALPHEGVCLTAVCDCGNSW